MSVAGGKSIPPSKKYRLVCFSEAFAGENSKSLQKRACPLGILVDTNSKARLGTSRVLFSSSDSIFSATPFGPRGEGARGSRPVWDRLPL